MPCNVLGSELWQYIISTRSTFITISKCSDLSSYVDTDIDDIDIEDVDIP